MRDEPKPIRNVILGALAVLIILVLFIRLAPFSYIWVLDNGQNLNKDYLIKLCPDGTRLVEIQFGSSSQIGVDPNTGDIWAPEMNDLGYVNENQLVKFNLEGNLLARYQGYRTGEIAVDPNDGSVWVGLVNENQVVKLNSEGEQILTASGVESPYAIAVDPRDSSVWVADGGMRHLIHFNREGEEIFRVPTKGFFSNTPHQLAVDPITGNIWYSGSFDERVYIRAAYGEPLTIVEGFDSPVAIAIDPRDNSAWVADFSRDDSGGVVKLDAHGDLLLKKVLDSPPWSIGFNPFDDTVWVGLEGSLVVLSNEGDLRYSLSGYTKPFSFAFVEVPNRFPAKVEFIRSCLFGEGEGLPRQYLKDTPTVNPNTPVIVTPSPVPTYTPTPTPTHTPVPTEIPLPSLTQINEDGFGEFDQQVIFGLESFNGLLFAGTYNLIDGSAHLFTYAGNWEEITPEGFFSESAVNDFHVFGDYLYLGTSTINPPAEIWRSSDGITWEKVILGTQEGEVRGNEVAAFFEIDGYLYAAFGGDENGAEIWRSQTGESNSWTKVAENGFGNPDNKYIYSAAKYQGRIILGTIARGEELDFDSQARFYHSVDGEEWSLLYEFNQDPAISQIASVKVFQNYLYAAIRFNTKDSSAKIVRCQICDGSDWEIVFEYPTGQIGYVRKPSLIEYNDHLFYVVGNDTIRDEIEENNGLEIWRSRDGLDWIQIAALGIDDQNNMFHYWENSLAIHNGKLYIGTINFETGGEVWELSD